MKALPVCLLVMALGCTTAPDAETQPTSSTGARFTLRPTDGQSQQPEQHQSSQPKRIPTPRPLPQAVAITGAAITGYQRPSLMTWVYVCPRCGNNWNGGIRITPAKSSRFETYTTCSKCRSRFKVVIQGIGP